MPNPTAAPLPCPFCKAPAELTTHGTNASPKRYARIQCTSCRVQMEVGAIRQTLEWAVAQVLAAWNRRAPSPSREGLALAKEAGELMEAMQRDWIQGNFTPHKASLAIRDWKKRMALSALEPSTGKAGWMPSADERSALVEDLRVAMREHHEALNAEPGSHREVFRLQCRMNALRLVLDTPGAETPKDA